MSIEIILGYYHTAVYSGTIELKGYLLKFWEREWHYRKYFGKPCFLYDGKYSNLNNSVHFSIYIYITTVYSFHYLTW